MSTDKTILVVEDEKTLLGAIKTKLEASGFQVLSARTGEEASKKIEENSGVDVIWLDHYLLGGETGLEFLVKIKGHEELKKIPVFVVSNTAGPEKKQAYLELGISKYFTKSTARLETIIEDIQASLERVE